MVIRSLEVSSLESGRLGRWSTLEQEFCGEGWVGGKSRQFDPEGLCVGVGVAGDGCFSVISFFFY